MMNVEFVIFICYLNYGVQKLFFDSCVDFLMYLLFYQGVMKWDLCGWCGEILCFCFSQLVCFSYLFSLFFEGGMIGVVNLLIGIVVRMVELRGEGGCYGVIVVVD